MATQRIKWQDDPGLGEFRDWIEEADLGPVTALNVLRPDRTTEVISVELDATAPGKAQALARWLDLITVADMTCGQFHASDAQVRLNVRGQLPSGRLVIVILPFDERAERQQVATIRAGINGQRAGELVGRLAAIETQGNKGND